MIYCKISNEEKKLLETIFASFEFITHNEEAHIAAWTDRDIMFCFEPTQQHTNLITFSIVFRYGGMGTLDFDDFMRLCDPLLKEKLMWHIDILNRMVLF